MKAYTTFYDDVMPELPGAELALVLHQIKNTCNDFYERSQYSREVLAGINIVAGTNSYTVAASAPTDFSIGKVLEVRVNTASSTGLKKLIPRTTNQLDAEMPNWDTAQGDMLYYTQRAIDNVIIARVPSAAYLAGLVVTIAKLPMATGGGIDDGVFNKFSESLAAGVKARMMRMPKKPWSNPGLAREYMQMYELEVAAAGAIAAKAYGAAPLRSRPCA